jgi:hypothetical protein
MITLEHPRRNYWTSSRKILKVCMTWKVEAEERQCAERVRGKDSGIRQPLFSTAVCTESS